MTAVFYDFEDDGACSTCGGDGFEECYDPIQCCVPGCDWHEHRCTNCNGSGLAKDQWYW